mmetsp:Transcript_1496/g.4848  ORF Transcript_1496/g.4848 Transcript_1496/m.4848 type:complete len:195 (+) Transcript_1496:351-935(+)
MPRHVRCKPRCPSSSLLRRSKASKENQKPPQPLVLGNARKTAARHQPDRSPARGAANGVLSGKQFVPWRAVCMRFRRSAPYCVKLKEMGALVVPEITQETCALIFKQGGAESYAKAEGCNLPVIPVSWVELVRTADLSSAAAHVQHNSVAQQFMPFYLMPYCVKRVDSIPVQPHQLPRHSGIVPAGRSLILPDA